jgi:hypothetical protein
LLLYQIFRAAPFALNRETSMLAMCFVVHFPWFMAQPLSYYPLLVFPIAGSPIYSQTDVEAGLFTYLPYILFLFFYCRFAARPGPRPGIALGLSAGFLTLVYYFHYIFAFAMILAFVIVKLIAGRKHEAQMGALALAVGVVAALPFVVNAWLSGPTREYIERLAFEPGRYSFEDYRWVLLLWLPAGITWLASIYDRENALTTRHTLLVLFLAFFGVLSLRLLMGFGVATDHYWRQSLAIPATVWFVGVTSRLMTLWPSRNLVSTFMRYAVVILPFFIFVRTTAAMAFHFSQPAPAASLTAEQRKALAAIECIDSESQPGEGMMASDIPVNYLAMVNLKTLPFVPTGLSTATLNTVTERYLMASFLTGQPTPNFTNAERAPDAYVHARDPELYLYVNLLQNIDSLDREEGFRRIFDAWNPEAFDWNARNSALQSVDVVYVDAARFEMARNRLQRFYEIESVTQCTGSAGSVIRVSAR